MEGLSENDYQSDDEETTQLPKKRKIKENDSKKASKKLKKELYRQPTTEEVNRMRETENLFNNNLFVLQLKELLSEVQVKEKYKKSFQTWFDKFSRFLKKLPERAEMTASEFNKKMKLRKPDFKCDRDVNIHFLKPSSFKIVGMHALNLAVGPTLNVDINIEMPKKSIYEKDYLNYRYLTKRYYYLVYIAAEMEKANICSEILLCYSHDFNAMPMLKIQPDTSTHITVKLSVVPPDGYFKDSRFLPNKNNLRITSDDEDGALKEEDLNKPATYYHNSLLLQNIRANQTYSFIQDLLQGFESATEGLQLLIVWLKQRQLYDVPGINDNFLLQLLAYLINQRSINKHTSSYQVLRSIWLFISRSDWSNEPISICKDVKSDTYALFKECFDVVFLDNSGCYNITSFLSLDVYSKLRYESKLAVQCLDGNVLNSFNSLFMKNLPFVLQYDSVLKLKSLQKFSQKKLLSDRKSKHLFSQGFPILATIKLVLNKLKMGLNKRANFLVPYFVQNELCFDFHHNVDVKSTSVDLFVGIGLDLDNAFNCLEQGPAPHDPKVKEFLDFWGELSALRRFPDGTTCETVFFETKTIKDKRRIVKKIIEHTVKTKLEFDCELVFDQFEDVMISKKMIPPFPTGTNEEVCLKVMAICDELNNKLRSFTLPLEITGILGNSDVFNYTEVFPPIPANYNVDNIKGSLVVKEDSWSFRENFKRHIIPNYVAPVENVIHLSLNSKWPDNLQAMRHLKTALLLKIAELLRQSNIKTNVTRKHLDVFYGGVVFRYTIYHPKEIALVKKTIDNNGLVSYKENKESVTLEKELDVGPRICSALKGIQSQYPSFGPSTALAKRWLRSHLLDDYHISDTVINLLNASLYLNSAPFSVPCLPQIGFLRFLKFLFETDWSVHLVIVNFNEELDRRTLEELEMDFFQHRDNYPNLCIITPYDDSKSMYTKTSPTKEVLRRVSVLAKFCYETFCNSLTGDSLIDVKSLFTPTYDGYDVIIYLKHTQNSKSFQNMNFKHKKQIQLKDKKVENEILPVVDFDPIDLYLKDLRQNFDKFAVFFRDNYGGNIIGVLWKPSAVGNIKVLDVLLEDFKIMGKDIVKKIKKVLQLNN